MKFLHTFQRKNIQSPASYSLIDVGRNTIKAAVVLMIPGNPEPQVVGYGTAETGDHDITGGRNEAEAVAVAVNQALIEAEDSAERYIGQKIVPDDAVFSVAGRAVLGKLFTVTQRRNKPSAPITEKELNALRLRAERLIPQGLAQSAFEGGQWQPLAVTDAGTLLDGRLVMGALGLTGRRLTFSVFGVAAQASALRALEVLAEQLDLAITNLVASPHALASAAPHTEAILLDVGLSGTDICLIKNNALVGADWIPFGGYFFTRSLARSINIEYETAETLKLDYANGELSRQERLYVERHLESPVLRWYDGVMEVLDILSYNGPLPRRIFMTGCGSRLSGLDRLLKTDPTPFEAAPEVTGLGPRSLRPVKDLTDTMSYDAMALALSLTVGLPEF